MTEACELSTAPEKSHRSISSVPTAEPFHLIEVIMFCRQTWVAPKEGGRYILWDLGIPSSNVTGVSGRLLRGCTLSVVFVTDQSHRPSRSAGNQPVDASIATCPCPGFILDIHHAPATVVHPLVYGWTAVAGTNRDR